MSLRIALHAAALWAAAGAVVDVTVASESGLLQLVGLPVAWALFARDRGPRSADPRWLIAASVLALGYAAASVGLPRLVAVSFAFASLGAILAAHVREPGRASGLFLLACSAAPLVDIVQALAGAPLRAAVSSSAAFLLCCAGIHVVADGVALVEGSSTVFVDPACSGLRYLWCAFLLAAVLAAWARLDFRRTAELVALAIPATFVANVLRAASLFFVERAPLDVARSQGIHAAVGVAGFALVSVLLVAFVVQRRRIA
ncbi:MAG TPA: exosortase/archaeosortase family protein [Planctomycetota bacterium]|nr:exosortase/archaeosortase family protein [Planctomycetota bacterium]